MNAETSMAFSTEISVDEVCITDAAESQLKKLFQEADDDTIEAIRVYVAGGGCGGMTYGMTFTDHCSRFDKVLQGDGYQFYVDSVAMQYMKGVEIDFVSRETGASFIFNNVFQSTGGSGACGSCGSAGGG